jgi:CBS domain-containing protein
VVARFGAEAVAALVDAFHFVHLLRLRTQVAGGPRGGTNRVDPSELNDLDRRVLKESFRQARKLQAVLARRYELGG